MVLPTVRINTYVKSEGKTYVDNVSKAFVYWEMFLGVNRCSIITDKRILVALFHVYSLTVNVIVCYVTLTTPFESSLIGIIRLSRLIQYKITAVISLFIWTRFRSFYKEIEKFDNEVGCRPKFSISSIKLLVLFGVLIIISLYFLSPYRMYLIKGVFLITTCEHFYFGYLIDLIIKRMRLFNYYLECSTSVVKTDSSPEITEFVFFDNDSRQFYLPNMGQMMELYQIILNAHKFLVDAVKWLMLPMVVIEFIYSLVASYNLVLVIEEDSFPFDFRFALLLMSYLQLFPPCMSSYKLQEEVCRFRELLASSLYENRLDRSSRGTTRRLLALTETRNLSFSLFRVLNITVSLPFSFLGLVVTYLIILMQFKKVLYS